MIISMVSGSVKNHILLNKSLAILSDLFGIVTSDPFKDSVTSNYRWIFEVLVIPSLKLTVRP